MKRFCFSLEKLLSYTLRLEDVEKQNLSRLRMRRAELFGQIQEMLKKERLYAAAFERACREGVSAGQAARLREALFALSEQIERMREQLRELDGDVARQIETLVALSRKRTSLERLKDKQETIYLAEQGRETEKFIEDFVQNRSFAANAG